MDLDTTIKILGFYQKFIETKKKNRKIQLKVLTEETGLPIAVIKQTLAKYIPDEELCENIAHWEDSTYLYEDYKMVKNSEGEYVKSEIKYCYFTGFGKKIKVHLWIVSQVTGIPIKQLVEMGVIIHHEDGNGLNNELENLLPVLTDMHRVLHGAINKFPEIDQVAFAQDYSDNTEYQSMLRTYLYNSSTIQKKLNDLYKN